MDAATAPRRGPHSRLARLPDRPGLNHSLVSPSPAASLAGLAIVVGALCVTILVLLRATAGQSMRNVPAAPELAA